MTTHAGRFDAADDPPEPRYILTTPPRGFSDGIGPRGGVFENDCSEEDLHPPPGFPRLKSFTLFGGSVFNASEPDISEAVWKNRFTLERFIYLPLKSMGAFPRPLGWAGDDMGRARFPHLKHILMRADLAVFPGNAGWIGLKDLRTVNFVVLVGNEEKLAPRLERIASTLKDWFSADAVGDGPAVVRATADLLVPEKLSAERVVSALAPVSGGGPAGTAAAFRAAAGIGQFLGGRFRYGSAKTVGSSY